jgi:phosphate transport system permease protein
MTSELTVVIHDEERMKAVERPVAGRRRRNQIFLTICWVTALLSLLILFVLLSAIFWQGFQHFDLRFLYMPPHPDPEQAGVWPAVWGTVWLCAICGVVTLPLGVATAIFLEEYPPRSWWAKKLHSFIQLNIANLAGVPSVVYGILGLTAFVNMFGLFGSGANPKMQIGVVYSDQYLTAGDEVVLVPAEGPSGPSRPLETGMAAEYANGNDMIVNVIGPEDPLPEDQEVLRRTLRSDATGGRISDTTWYYVRLPFGRGVLAGGLTLMLVVLPVLIISTQEALRAVPNSLREGALGMGCTRWQMIYKITLPAAMPGIMTGSILAMSRAIGEAAPLLMIAGIVFIKFAPDNLMDDFTALPLQIYNWAQRPQDSFHQVAASGIIVLLVVLLAFNGLAIFLRQRFQKPLS